jgi:antitoxin component YwqK of YwqJK toxin-antitoxin module
MKTLVSVVMSIMVLGVFAQEPVKKEFYKDGTLKAEYVLNSETSIWASFYHPNGTVREMGKYEEGKPDGFWQSWDQEGSKLCEAQYSHGVKDGKWLFWKDQGSTQYEVHYDDNEIVNTLKWVRSEVVLED